MSSARVCFHVVVQSSRGTGGSGGSFDLWHNEAPDGQATVGWLRRQAWFTGAFATVGASYLGYVQWALAEDPPPEWRAAVVQVGMHHPYQLFYAGGALTEELAVVGQAYPRFARNTGTGEPTATATTLIATDITVHHAPGRASALILPVV